MTKKDYIMIAKVIRDNTIINDGMMLEGSINKITMVSALCNELHKDNRLFNARKFIDACGVDDD